MRLLWTLSALAVTAWPAPACASDRSADTETGTAEFQVIGDQDNIPARYRLQPHKFEYTVRKEREDPDAGFDVYRVTFSSPVETPHKENNTVHADYYRPRGKDHFPCVIVLDITGGDQKLSKFISSYMAQNGVGALFVQMAYYGPRRPPGSRLRLLSYDVDHTFKAIRQTVLDIRRATAWMASRPEIDADQLGIIGTSLGGFIAALSAEMEPRLGKVAILLAGGGLIDGYYDHPQAAPYRGLFELLGGTKEQAKEFFAPVDPLTCAANLKDRQVLMISARNDEIVPASMAEALWKATGEQKIVWFPTSHYGMALYLTAALRHVREHFVTAPPRGPAGGRSEE